MASSRGRKRRSRQGRRSRKERRSPQGRRSQKERRSQQGRRQKSRGRRSPAKQRKHRGQTKRRRAKKQRKRTSNASFHSFSARTFNQAKRDSWFLSHQAEGFMIGFMENVYVQVSNEAEKLRRESCDPRISPEHVQAALRRVVPKRRQWQRRRNWH